MKIFVLLLLITGLGFAADYSNEGKQQNDVGYYGEGVVFGGYDIVGEWRLCSDEIATLRTDGSIWGSPYGVSVDGKFLILDHGMTVDVYDILEVGNDGCFHVKHLFQHFELSTDTVTYCNVCKVTVNDKTFGAASTGVDISVGAR